MWSTTQAQQYLTRGIKELAAYWQWSSVSPGSNSSSSGACSSPVELLSDVDILQRPLQKQRHQRPVQLPLTLQGLRIRTSHTGSLEPPRCTALRWALYSKHRKTNRLPGPTVAETSPALRLEFAWSNSRQPSSLLHLENWENFSWQCYAFAVTLVLLLNWFKVIYIYNVNHHQSNSFVFFNILFI